MAVSILCRLARVVDVPRESCLGAEDAVAIVGDSGNERATGAWTRRGRQRDEVLRGCGNL